MLNTRIFNLKITFYQVVLLLLVTLLNISLPGEAQVRIYDLLGNLIYENNNMLSKTILEGFNTGSYFLKIIGADFMVSKKIIVH